jgi:DNA-binding beta-propeller fold protein YncE
VTQTWQPGCGEDGPKGLALDHALNFLFVACSNGVKVVDAGHQGAILSSFETGPGVDNIDYLEARHELYAAAARAAKLVVARIDPQGKANIETTVDTAAGARNAVVTEEGAAYLTDSAEGKILVVGPR